MGKVTIVALGHDESILYGLKLMLQRDIEEWLEGGEVVHGKRTAESFAENVNWKYIMGRNGKELGLIHTKLSEEIRSHPVIFYANDLSDGWLSFLSAGVCGFIAIKDHVELPTAIDTVRMGGYYLSKTYKRKMCETFASAVYSPPTGEMAELTQMERSVILEITKDQSNKEVATRLHISERTVEHHVSMAMKKVGAKSRVGLVVNYLNHCRHIGSRSIDSGNHRNEYVEITD